jgi:hypothetical protein
MKSFGGASPADFAFSFDKIKKIWTDGINRSIFIEHFDRSLKLSNLFSKLGRLFFETWLFSSIRQILGPRTLSETGGQNI